MLKDIRDIKVNEAIKTVVQITDLIQRILTPTESSSIYIPTSGAGVPKRNARIHLVRNSG